MNIRSALPDDADQMSRVLNEIFSVGQRSRQSSQAFVLQSYIEHPSRIQCSVALDNHGSIVGFQSLKMAWAGNPYDVPEGWGIIGTHISPLAARRGAGAALFKASLAAARAAGLKSIDASIGEHNHAGLAYYDAMGFETYRKMAGCICKVFKID